MVALCAFWWLYVGASSHMILLWDAAEYNALGEMLHRDGWQTFLATGPHREPLYPLLVASALRVSEWLSLHYQKVLVGLQFGIVGVTQLLMLWLARLMGIGRPYALAAVAYFGLSPAVVNSACSMFSEVLAYPFVLAGALFAGLAWAAVDRGQIARTVCLAGVTGAVLAVGAFVKGVLHYVSLLIALLFVVRTVEACCRRRRATAVAALVAAIATLAFAEGTFRWYKDLNRRYNGQPEFTTRYLWLLYGNAAKRAIPFTTRQVLAHVVAIPGGTVCQLFFSKEECEFCEFGVADELGLVELPRRLQGVPETEQRAVTMRLVREKILEHPVQYVFVAATQVLRMPFWESSQLGYVEYPPWLARLYRSFVVQKGLRLLAGLATTIALGWGVRWLLRSLARRRQEPVPAPVLLAFFSCATFMLLYAPFSVLTRYALPIAPLYLLLVAAMLDYLFRRPPAPDLSRANGSPLATLDGSGRTEDSAERAAEQVSPAGGRDTREG